MVARPLPRLVGDGAIAQLGERLVCNQKVAGSSPAGSIPKVGLLIAISVLAAAKLELAFNGSRVRNGYMRLPRGPNRGLRVRPRGVLELVDDVPIAGQRQPCVLPELARDVYNLGKPEPAAIWPGSLRRIRGSRSRPPLGPQMRGSCEDFIQELAHVVSPYIHSKTRERRMPGFAGPSVGRIHPRSV